MKELGTFVAFEGHKCVAYGELQEVVARVREYIDESGTSPEASRVLFFEDRTGRQVDFDLSGSPRQVVERLAKHPLVTAARGGEKQQGPGRPKLGVVSREVSLLPRHWEWLGEQRGGMSVAIRELVENAMKRGKHAHLARKAREAAAKFMWTVAGDLPGFEEASRSLYAKDIHALGKNMKGWPKDVRAHVERLVAEATKLDALATLEST
ncbi:MAG: DUF2239 family protein [Polyangiaceae bacterium]